MCPNFCMLYYLKNAELTECMTCGHSYYKPRTGMGKTLIAYKKLRYFPITPRLQRLFMSPKTAEHMIWHQSYDVVDGVMVHGNTLTVCILTFQLNQGTCILGCGMTDSTHLGHLPLFILIGQLYSLFSCKFWFWFWFYFLYFFEIKQYQYRLNEENQWF
jgi:hypothetical protein